MITLQYIPFAMMYFACFLVGHAILVIDAEATTPAPSNPGSVTGLGRLVIRSYAVQGQRFPDQYSCTCEKDNKVVLVENETMISVLNLVSTGEIVF